MYGGRVWTTKYRYEVLLGETWGGAASRGTSPAFGFQKSMICLYVRQIGHCLLFRSSTIQNIRYQTLHLSTSRHLRYLSKTVKRDHAFPYHLQLLASKGSKRAWKKRRYFGSYVIRNPLMLDRSANTDSTDSATTSM